MLKNAEWVPNLGWGTKRIDTKVSILLGLQFPLFHSLAKIRERRPLRKGERQRIFSTAGEHSVLPCRNPYTVSDTVLLHIRLSPRRGRHDSAAQFFSALYRPAPSNLDVRHNLSSQVLSVISRLTSCAALLCRACGNLTACVAERYLTLRTGCERHGRKNPLPYPISERSHIGNLRQIRKQGKGRSSKRKGNRRCPFLFALRRGYGAVPAAGAAPLPPSADGESPPLNLSEKHPAR